MRTTVNLKPELVEAARRYTGIKRKTDLLHEALQRLVREEAGKRLIALGGTMPDARAAPRRRFPRRKA